MTSLATIRAALRDCPPILRRQQSLTLRLARAFRDHDEAEALLTRARAELDEAFSMWAAGRTTNRKEAREMLELAGMIERKRI